MDHDLHSLLAAAKDDAPPPRLSIDDITAAGRQLVRRRRRRTLLSSVAGGIVAVITGATAAVVLFTPPTAGPAGDPNGLTAETPAPGRRTDFAQVTGFETNYSGYTAGRYRVSDPDLVTADYQQSTIVLNSAAPAAASSTSQASPAGATSPARTFSPSDTRDDDPGGGRLVVYDTGAFSTREFSGGEKLQIGGRPALLQYAGVPAKPSLGKSTCCVEATVPTIAWQYMTDTWAVIYWSPFDSTPTREELVGLAEALPAADPRPFPVGFQMKNPPRNYRLLAVSTRKSPADETNLSVVRLAAKPPVPPLTAPIAFDDYPSIVLTLGVTSQMMADLVGKTSCPTGGTICATIIEDGQFFLQVETVGTRTLSTGELSQFLKTMVAEQPTDRSNWPAADTVFTP